MLGEAHCSAVNTDCMDRIWSGMHHAGYSQMCCLLQEELSPETLMMKAVKGKGHYDSWHVLD